MKAKPLRVAIVLALLVIACSSPKEEDKGCAQGISERACSTNEDCKGFTGGITLFGPSDECQVAACGPDGQCIASVLTDTLLDDTSKGDCSRPKCDENGHLVRVINRSDVGPSSPTSSFGSSSCRRRRCVDGFFGGSASPTEESSPDGDACELPGRGLAGECQGGVCMEPAPPPDAGKKNDAGVAGDAGDAGIEEDAAADAATD